MRSTSLAFLVVSCLATAVLAADYLRDEGGSALLQLGNCVSALEDQDGDGCWEMLVGAPGYNGSGMDAGRAYLWIGGLELTLNANEDWTGASPERFGFAVSRIGDVDGDGTGDWAVGAPMANNAGSEAGRVYVYFGDWPLPTTPDLILEGPAPGGRFGWSIAPLGDFDGDGRDDFAVGAPRTSTGGLQAGAAYVYYGASGGPASTPDLTLLGGIAYGHFGWSVAGVADFLGGSANCLAVGAPSHDTPSSAIQGSVFVYQGTTTPNPGPDTTADLTLQSSATAAANNEFGFSIAGIGSYDGDSDPDLVVGIPGYNGSATLAGRAEIFYGGLDADDVSDRYANGPAANAHFGWSVAGVGDIAGTSRPDVVVGAPYDDAIATDAGRAFIWEGGDGNVGDADNLTLVDRGTPVVGTEADDRFGYWVAWAGDLDGDERDDYAVGAPGGNVATLAVAGWVRFLDSSGVAVPAQLGAWSCRWTADGALAGAVGLVVPPADVAGVSVTRHDLAAGANTVLHTGPADGRTVRVDGRQLHIIDPDAAYQTSGLVAYDLTVALGDGSTLVRQALAGPDQPVPAAVLQLGAAHPNPFNPRTVLDFRAQAGAPVELGVYDLGGRHVRTLHAGPATGSWQQAAWDGRDEQGRAQPAGVYLVRVEAGDAVRQGRVVLAK